MAVKTAIVIHALLLLFNEPRILGNEVEDAGK